MLEPKDREIYDLKQEVDFLLNRARKASKLSFSDGWNRFTGISSDALVHHAWAGTMPSKGEYPSDTGDLVAGWNTVQMLPAHRKAAGLRILEAYEAHIREKSDEYWARYREVIAERTKPQEQP